VARLEDRGRRQRGSKKFQPDLTKYDITIPRHVHEQRSGQRPKIVPFHSEIAEVAEGSFKRKKPPEIVGSGYVVKSLEAALWVFHDAEDFREAVLRAVNLGDDADTTGAVCGQLAGAYWGESAIPREWLEGLARRDMIEHALEGIL